MYSFPLPIDKYVVVSYSNLFYQTVLYWRNQLLCIYSTLLYCIDTVECQAADKKLRTI